MSRPSKNGPWIEDRARQAIRHRIRNVGVTASDWLQAIRRDNPFRPGDWRRGLWRLYAVDQLKKELSA